MVNLSKRLLFCGGSFADVPLILAAKKLGYYVITTGNQANGDGHKVADEYYACDFSDVAKMLKLARKLKIDAVCSSCNDFSAPAAAYIAEKLNLPGHDSYTVALNIHHKDLYRKFAKKHGIQTPKAISCKNIKSSPKKLNTLKFPLIVKPVDLTGGKGITKVTEHHTLLTAIQKAFLISKANRVVIEEFITGSKHGFSAFLVDKKVAFYFVDNEYYFKNPYSVSAASTPTLTPLNAQKKLVSTAEKIADILNLKDGIFHVQFILNEEEPIIIEICRRAPGDLYIELVKYATGVDYPELIVSSQLGLDCKKIMHVEPSGFYTRHCIMSARPGRLKKINFDNTVKDNIFKTHLFINPGENITDFLTQKIGIVFLKFSTMQEMLQKTEDMPNLIDVMIT